MTSRTLATNTSAIAASGLTIRFRREGQADLSIVENLTIDLPPGTFACFSGRSGSGKTSILRCLAGLTTPTAGTISWWGRPLDTMPGGDIRELRRTRLSYVDQGSTLVDALTALDNVLLPALPDGRAAVRERREAAVDLLETLQLGQRVHHRPRTLSGGERQRVAIARALLMGPDVVVADEPTASLDRGLADDVIAVLRAHADAGGTVLVASHDPAVAEAADQLTRLEG